VSTLILLRHGQSQSNRDNLFTGWSDPALTEKGRADAEAAGRSLAEAGHRVDVCFSSVLQRGVESARAALRGLGQPDLEVQQSWCLNERHFGALQQMSRQDAIRRYGRLRVYRWRRSYAYPPPPLADDDPRTLEQSQRFADLGSSPLPRSESFADTRRRVAPYWYETILPHLQSGESVLVVAHKNSLRVLAQEIEGLDDAAVPRLNLPTAHPIVLEFDDDLKRIGTSPIAEKPRSFKLWGRLSPA
jgi:2,3-bisphosphoglycerate-dependent phosphoglycerate mutase